MDVRTTTSTDVSSTQANAPDLFAFGETVAESLAQEIAGIPEIMESPTRIVIELGTLENRTNTPTGDFELIQRRLVASLQGSRHLQKYAMVVEPRSRMGREYQEIVGEDPDLLQDSEGQGGPRGYAPRDTYVLQGDFHEISRGRERTYFFDFKLTNLASRAVVFNKSFERKYQ